MAINPPSDHGVEDLQAQEIVKMKPQTEGSILAGGEPAAHVIRQFAAAGVSLIETRFSPHAYLPEHAHDDAFFCLAVRGPFRELTRGQRLDRENGSVIFHAPGETHADRFGQDGGSCFNIELGRSWDERLHDLLPSLNRRAIRLRRNTSLYCEKLRAELWRSPTPSALSVEGLSLLLLADASEADEGLDAWHPPRWIYAVRDYLHDTFRDAPTIVEVARVVRAHPVHVARIFRRVFACGIAEYVRRLRLDEARRQLADGTLTIAEIALAGGFADQSHLTRAFRREWGMTPGEYRRRLTQR